jgi:hypothetical protein
VSAAVYSALRETVPQNTITTRFSAVSRAALSVPHALDRYAQAGPTARS